MICGMDPNEADARLEQLMAERDAVISPLGVWWTTWPGGRHHRGAER
jgi:hypothetical protein